MDLFLAQNHAPMTHLPIAASILAALAAIAAIFIDKREIRWTWGMLTIIAFLTVIPTIATGIAAGIGRNYIEQGIMVADTPDNQTIRIHQMLGSAGALVALVSAIAGVWYLRGKKVSRPLAAILALTVAILWGIGGHLGGSALWGPDTFPAYEQTEQPE